MKKNIEYKQIEFKAQSTARDPDGRLRVVAYAAVFDNVDSYNDIIKKGSFIKTIKNEGKRIAVCWQHEMRRPIAKLMDVKEDNFGLLVEFVISKSEEDVAVKVEEGIITEMSIGYITVEFEYNTADEVRILKELRLYEVSLVTRAANDEAKIKDEAIDNKSISCKEIDGKCTYEINTLKDSELTELKEQINQELFTRLIKQL